MDRSCGSLMRKASAQVQPEPLDSGRAGHLELRQVRVEVTALDGHQALGLQCTFEGRELEIGQGDGETRAIHCPGSYIRAARVDRTVTLFSQAPSGSGWRKKSMASGAR